MRFDLLDEVLKLLGWWSYLARRLIKFFRLAGWWSFRFIAWQSYSICNLIKYSTYSLINLRLIAWWSFFDLQLNEVFRLVTWWRISCLLLKEKTSACRLLKFFDNLLKDLSSLKYFDLQVFDFQILKESSIFDYRLWMVCMSHLFGSQFESPFWVRMRCDILYLYSLNLYVYCSLGLSEFEPNLHISQLN